jgi:hypothetical protein
VLWENISLRGIRFDEEETKERNEAFKSTKYLE